MLKQKIQFNTSKLAIVAYGVLIGFLTGVLVSLFRLSIEKILAGFQALYLAVGRGDVFLLMIIILLNISCLGVAAWGLLLGYLSKIRIFQDPASHKLKGY